MDEDKQVYTQTIESCIHDNKEYSIIYGIKVQGRLKYIQAQGRCAIIDDQRCLISIKQDITHLISIQEQLTKSKRDAEDALEAKTIFLANMSHEIRTPINAIMGMDSLLLTTELTKEQYDFAEIINESCKTLLSLINNILDFSKIESNKIVVQETDIKISRLIETLERYYKPIVDKKCLELIIDAEYDSDLIRTDETLLKQILTNLLNNAIKFTKTGSITLYIRKSQFCLEVTVTDTGIGISEKDQKKLFSPFVQADLSNTKQYGGTGLGLAICKTIIELLRGTISLKSTENIGSQFDIMIPLNSTINDIIVIVEDNNINQYVLKKYLEKLNYTGTRVYNNGQEILNDIKNIKPYIIFMDLQMPILDGYTASKELRKLGITCPIIAVTAMLIKDDNERCKEYGIDDIIYKPYTIENLKDMLKKHIRN